MHRRQVGEWKSIIKTVLQGMRMTLCYFSRFSKSSAVSYSPSSRITSKLQGHPYDMTNHLPARGGCYRRKKKAWVSK